MMRLGLHYGCNGTEGPAPLYYVLILLSFIKKTLPEQWSELEISLIPVK